MAASSSLMPIAYARRPSGALAWARYALQGCLAPLPDVQWRTPVAEKDRELSDEELENAAGGMAMDHQSMPEGEAGGTIGLEADTAQMPPTGTGGPDMRRKIRRHDPPTGFGDYGG